VAAEKLRVRSAEVWKLADTQHGVVSRSQLADLGMSPAAIRHRLARGRLHRLMPGIYVVGRPKVEDRGRWMAAVLACGPGALLSHRSAAALAGICKPWPGPVEIVVPASVVRRPPGIKVYRRRMVADLEPLRPRLVDDIPVTAPAVTLVDLATCLGTGQLEAAVNEADHRNLIDPEALRAAIDLLSRRPGARRLRTLLDTASHALTTTALERYFLPLAHKAGLPLPQTQAPLGGHRVDFYWPELGLIVETDSLRYHRTPFKQAADKRRDNKHAGSGLTTLRFTHWQVQHEPDYVRKELRSVAHLLAARGKAPAR
jgi:predicted transcriptional regulator of viral defense system